MVADPIKTRLAKDFNKGDFKTGASYLKLLSWHLISLIFFRSGLIPFSNVLVFLLKAFGAEIGRGVRLKPHLNIKYPWKLRIGDCSWLDSCAIENLVEVTIGSHVCISQGVLILTGNHNYKLESFDLITAPVVLEDGVWISANSTVCPGVTAKSHSVLSVAAVAAKDLEAYGIYSGNPAQWIRRRVISATSA